MVATRYDYPPLDYNCQLHGCVERTVCCSLENPGVRARFSYKLAGEGVGGRKKKKATKRSGCWTWCERMACSSHAHSESNQYHHQRAEAAASPDTNPSTPPDPFVPKCYGCCIRCGKIPPLLCTNNKIKRSSALTKARMHAIHRARGSLVRRRRLSRDTGNPLPAHRARAGRKSACSEIAGHRRLRPRDLGLRPRDDLAPHPTALPHARPSSEATTTPATAADLIQRHVKQLGHSSVG